MDRFISCTWNIWSGNDYEEISGFRRHDCGIPGCRSVFVPVVVHMSRRRRRDTEPVLYAVIELIFWICALPFIMIACLILDNKNK